MILSFDSFSRLYFLTAHEHFKNGCPALALEVLMKLPPYIVFPEEEDEETADRHPSAGRTEKDPEIQSSTSRAESRAQEFDWSKPVVSSAGIPSKVEDFDWSQPLTSRERFGGDDDDDDELKLDFGLDDDDDEYDDNDEDGNDGGKKQDEEKVEQTKLPTTNGDDDNAMVSRR